ncbi:MAG TPA: Stk1 family PASTA domain-containing Ser/Thr kinase [Actinomycetota bacterium]|nr:Stk1 family PASTA domain-containing Ser/Thr kinase [Actinomycetota bacterium]
MKSVLSDRYQVEARIGAGGMAEVYRGFDPVLNRTVAIKVLLPQMARDTSFVERFRREAQAAARLNQSNIVGVYDTGSDDGTQYIVMEFIEGRTLAEFMATGRRPTPVQAAEIAQKICAAIAAAHAQGVIHRDIKPGNVMITREGVIKVMDFGIARVLGPETAPQTSAVLGTASYLSPEQAQGGPVDARTDIYSLGAVLYELLTGRPPFTGDTPVAVAYKQVNETPAVPSSLNPDVPARLDAVVMKALSKNPSNRYQTADEFSADLARVVAGQEVEATPLMAAGGGDATQVISRPSSRTAVLPPPEEPKGSGRKVWLGILIGLLLFALLAGGGYLLVDSLTGDDSGGTVTVIVPNVVGETQAAAEAELEELGLEVDVRRREVDPDETEPGTVVAQDPRRDEEVARGSTVTITVAVEPDTVAVPSLEGLTVSQAQTELRAADLTLGSTLQEASADIDEGLVIRSEPAVDAEVEPGSAVDIYVSTGPEMVEVPDVSTGCLSVGGANQLLRPLGLLLEEGEPAPSTPDCPNPSRIIGQEPAPGTLVEAGSVVTVFRGGGGDV